MKECDLAATGSRGFAVRRGPSDLPARSSSGLPPTRKRTVQHYSVEYDIRLIPTRTPTLRAKERCRALFQSIEKANCARSRFSCACLSVSAADSSAERCSRSDTQRRSCSLAACACSHSLPRPGSSAMQNGPKRDCACRRLGTASVQAYLRFSEALMQLMQVGSCAHSLRRRVRPNLRLYSREPRKLF